MIYIKKFKSIDKWIEELPYSEIITCKDGDEK